MRTLPISRIVLGLLILIGAIGIAWLNFSWVLINPPLSYSTQSGSATVSYTVSQTHLRPGDCITFAWQVDGIREVHVNGQGAIGADHRDICVGVNAQQAPAMSLTILFQDQIEVTYVPQVVFHATPDFTLLLALLIIGVAILIAPAKTPEFNQRVRVVVCMFVPIGLGLGLAALILFALGNIMSVKAVDQFVNKPWYSVLDSSRCGYIEVSPYSTQPERIMFDELPKLDNSQGQILIFGTSNAVESLLPYDLNSYDQSHILNLAMGATTPLEYEALLSYLDQNKNLLKPKAGKTAIVLAFWSAVFAKHPWHYLYEDAFRLYKEYDLQEASDTDWILSPTNDNLAPIMMAQARTQSLFSHQLPFTTRRLLFPDVERQLFSDTPGSCRPVNPNLLQLQRADFWRDYHGGDAYVLPNEATVPLERMAQRASIAGVPILVIDLPLPSWLRNTVYQQRYMTYMADFVAKYHASVYNLSDLLGDDGFRDTAHPTIDSRHTLTKAMLDIFVKEGLLPPGS